jgi:hypothetical protein
MPSDLRHIRDRADSDGAGDRGVSTVPELAGIVAARRQLATALKAVPDALGRPDPAAPAYMPWARVVGLALMALDEAIAQADADVGALRGVYLSAKVVTPMLELLILHTDRVAPVVAPRPAHPLARGACGCPVYLGSRLIEHTAECSMDVREVHR